MKLVNGCGELGLPFSLADSQVCLLKRTGYVEADSSLTVLLNGMQEVPKERKSSGLARCLTAGSESSDVKQQSKVSPGDSIGVQGI